MLITAVTLPVRAELQCEAPIAVDFSLSPDVHVFRIFADGNGCISSTPASLNIVFEHARKVIDENNQPIFFFIQDGLNKHNFLTVGEILENAPSGSGFLVYNGDEIMMLYMTD
jgi:hypothetical protein